MRRLVPAAILTAAALAVLAAAGGVPVASAAKPTTTTVVPTTTSPANVIYVSPVGDYATPATANISGSATCTDPSGFGTVTFNNAPGTSYVIAGETQVVCDGQSHTWATTITSPSGSFTPGQAYLIEATLVAGGTTTGPLLFKVALQ